MFGLNKKLYGSPRNASSSNALLKKALSFTIGASLLAGAYGDMPLKGQELQRSDETKIETVDLENMGDEIPDDIINPDMEVLPEGSRPYLVSLRSPDPTNTVPHICAGTLISSRVVLTAAHCVVSGVDGSWDPPSAVDFNRYYRRDGTNNPSLITYTLCAGQDGAGCAPDEAYAVASPFYDAFTVPRFDHDWALIILPANAPRDDIVPVALNTDDNIPEAGAPIEVFGWGHTSKNPVTRPDTPMTVTLRYVQQSICSLIFQGRGTVITDNMLCVYNDERASCQGDSGGPSVIDYPDGSTVQNGVVSFGPNGCTVDGVPNVMVRVSKVYPWIAAFACARTGEFCPTPATTPAPTMSAKSSKGPPPTYSPSGSPTYSPTMGKSNKAAIVEGGSTGNLEAGSMSMSMSMSMYMNDIEFGKKRRRHLA